VSGRLHGVVTDTSAETVAKLLRYMLAAPADIIAAMLRVLYLDAATAIDLTPGSRRFWNGTAHVEVTFSTHDYTALPFANGAYDVAILDPPHLEDGGRRGIMARRFGTYTVGELESQIRAGCREAMRVARLGAIVKVTDHVHGQRFRHQSAWVCDELGTPYEIVHQVRPGNLEDGKWRNVLSARSNGAVYLAFRHGDQRHVGRARPARRTA
jgi:hypothetical protein